MRHEPACFGGLGRGAQELGQRRACLDPPAIADAARSRPGPAAARRAARDAARRRARRSTRVGAGERWQLAGRRRAAGAHRRMPRREVAAAESRHGADAASRARRPTPSRQRTNRRFDRLDRAELDAGRASGCERRSRQDRWSAQRTTNAHRLSTEVSVGRLSTTHLRRSSRAPSPVRRLTWSSECWSRVAAVGHHRIALAKTLPPAPRGRSRARPPSRPRARAPARRAPARSPRAARAPRWKLLARRALSARDRRARRSAGAAPRAAPSYRGAPAARRIERCRGERRSARRLAQHERGALELVESARRRRARGKRERDRQAPRPELSQRASRLAGGALERAPLAPRSSGRGTGRSISSAHRSLPPTLSSAFSPSPPEARTARASLDRRVVQARFPRAVWRSGWSSGSVRERTSRTCSHSARAPARSPSARDRDGEVQPRRLKVGVVLGQRARADLEHLLDQRPRAREVAERTDRVGEAQPRRLQVGVVLRQRARADLEDLLLERPRAREVAELRERAGEVPPRRLEVGVVVRAACASGPRAPAPRAPARPRGRRAS